MTEVATGLTVFCVTIIIQIVIVVSDASFFFTYSIVHVDQQQIAKTLVIKQSL